ncbi:MAG: hypothetical protein AB1595_02705 [bacterium]
MIKYKLSWVSKDRPQDLKEDSGENLLKTIEFIMYQYWVKILGKDKKSMYVKRNVVRLLK